MRIETKFDIGQEVYYVDEFCACGVKQWQVEGPCKITGVTAWKDDEGNTEEWYHFKDTENIELMDCFATHKAAQQEADRRNEGK